MAGRAPRTGVDLDHDAKGARHAPAMALADIDVVGEGF